MLSPRAADDFEIIRGRLEELRRQRARISSETADDRLATGSKPYSGARSSESEQEGHALPRSVRQKLSG
jgi:hypothetical protein